MASLLSPDQMALLLLVLEIIEVGVLLVIVALLFRLVAEVSNLLRLLLALARQPAAILSLLSDRDILAKHPELIAAIGDRLSELNLEDVLNALDQKPRNEP